MQRIASSAMMRTLTGAAEATGAARLYSTKPITATLFPGDGTILNSFLFNEIINYIEIQSLELVIVLFKLRWSPPSYFFFQFFTFFSFFSLSLLNLYRYRP
jgi:hypothetical protein